MQQPRNRRYPISVQNVNLCLGLSPGHCFGLRLHCTILATRFFRKSYNSQFAELRDLEINMRSLLALLVAAVLTTSLAAQQSTPEQSQPSQNQQQKKQPPKQPAPEKEKKSEEPPTKNTEPAPSQPDQKPSDDKKDLHFDMTEVAPIVTHHQTTAEGKTLKYTATAGRLPIKRADGKIEAEMFF